MKLRSTGTALAIAAALFAQTPAHAAGSPLPPGSQPGINSLGGDLYASFIGESAHLRSELWFFGSVNPGPSQSPATGQFLFANKGSANSSYNGSAGLGSPTSNLNNPAYGGFFGAGANLVFGLFVKDLNAGAGRWFYTGDFNRNPDSRIHAKVMDLGGGTVEVGFEDLCKVNAADPICGIDQLSVDWDYNDHRFLVNGATTTTPEPVSMALLGTGLAGLAAARRRKKNAEQDS